MGKLTPQMIEVRFNKSSLAEVERTRRRLAALRVGLQAAPPAPPFFVVTPLGLAQRPQLMRLLAEQQVQVAGQTLVADWAAAATAIYVRTLDDERLRVALCFEALWRIVAAARPAELWQLADAASFARLEQAKPTIRAALDSRRFRPVLPGVILRTPGQIVRLHPFHVPDPAHLNTEAYLLKQWSAQTPNRLGSESKNATNC